jgi:hypothetical protein
MTRFVLFVLCIACASAQQRIEVSRDLWISNYETEREGNNGGSPKLKLKGIQEFFLIDFDPTSLAGKRVQRAQLHLHLEGPETLGRITVSTVTEEWVEGTGTGYAKVPGATSFTWLRTDEQRWRDVDLTGSALGQGGSIWGFGDATKPDAEGWQVIPIDPAVVQARLDGRSHGFFVIDDVGSEYTRNGNAFEYQNFPNRYVASREGKKATKPYFTLWLEDGTVPAPVAEPASAPSEGFVRLPERGPTPREPLRAILAGRDQIGQKLEDTEFYAARGETIGFSVAADAKDVTVFGIAGLEAKLFAMPKIGEHFDPLVPAGFEGAPLQGGEVYLDIHVPKDAKPGRYEGLIALTSGAKIRFAVTIWNFTLPDRLSFLPQMNAYGLPDGQQRAYYRLAQENRTVLNWLPYGWTGKVKSGPKIQGDGTWDWTEWDAEYGPIFDGSAFADLPRGAVPIEAFYLPLNENWPMDHEKHFRGGYWIESAYDDAYWSEFRAAAGKFAEHFAAKGWTEPMFEFYLNNKVYFKQERGNRWDGCSAPWVFDEPVNTQDFWALRRFGLEFWDGVAAHPGPRFTYRADISRPEWQRQLLDGVTSVEVVSGVLRAYRNRVIGRAEQFDNLVYMYGSANKLGTPNVMPAAWCVETWALGADGVVPWQTIGKADSWQTPDELSLFYPTPNGPVPSLRLKSFRAGQQLVEYLTIYAELSGQNRSAVGATVLRDFELRAELKKVSEADAGSSLFPQSASRSLNDLRMRLGQWINDRYPAPRERWHDPRPSVRDSKSVPAVIPLAALE